MKGSWRDRLRYAFDNLMSRGTVAQIGALGVLSLVVIAVAATIVAASAELEAGGTPDPDDLLGGVAVLPLRTAVPADDDGCGAGGP